LCFAGDYYCKVGKYEDSLRCFEKVTESYSDYKFAWYALFMVGRNFESMKNLGLISESEADPKIKAAYQKLVSKWPGSNNAEYAQTWLNEHNSK
jgi:outer membrane protein assembly factor BamD (BamD/ComL family)